MKRDIVFCNVKGQLAVALGIAPERIKAIETFVNEMLDRDCNLRQIIETANETLELNDAEWSNLMFALGYMQGRNGVTA